MELESLNTKVGQKMKLADLAQDDQDDDEDYKKIYDVVDIIKLSLYSNLAGIGVTFRPNVKCFNKYDFEIVFIRIYIFFYYTNKD